ncbi:PIG-L family deacetylase [Hymenobacter persicinus]|uniref:LmbE family protein n=1 Tax=Hymenobacter persicinus TaxID=2025506 RepID=A0A4Q5LDZ8_9BACT|nr:PIG-L family deacetylase [Hymenobacter persicinus]RYU82156.1 LmbE family protein [Hymenobacter persicinus]
MRFPVSGLRAALLLVLLPLLAPAQAPKTTTSSEILLGLKKLNVLGSVLYLAAHPDDENTRLIAYLANGRLVETGYLSCTRGDGGQNLIGPELREQLGVIRTQELLAARRIDGGRQFFTRANDFGFSKTSDETFTIWDKEQVLSDMVWVIRQRRPDVLIARFPPDARAGHGHHQASAILAAEAFDAAGNPNRFPEQLQYVQVWSPKRLVWNTGSFFVKPGENMDGYLKLDAGGFNPLLGQSYGEIAARSRSQHRSQGFGSAAQRGEAPEYFQLVKGARADKDLFDGVDMTWNRVPGGAAVGKQLDEVIRKYNSANPSASVAGLLKVRETIRTILATEKDRLAGGFPAQGSPQYFWAAEKAQEVEQLIRGCLGLTIEALAPTASLGESETTRLRIELLNRSDVPVIIKEVSLDGATPGLSRDTAWTPLLTKDKPLVLRPRYQMRKCGPLSQPYWLRNPSDNVGMYALTESFALNRLVRNTENPDAPQTLVTQYDQDHEFHLGETPLRQYLGQPENPAVAAVSVTVQVGPGAPMLITVPVQYKHTDPTLGELYQPLAAVPIVMVNLPAARAYVFASQEPKTVPVTVRAGRAGLTGTVVLKAPEGWNVEPKSASFELKNRDEEQTVNFRIQPGAAVPAGKTELRAYATVNAFVECVDGPEQARRFYRGVQTIAYPHIPTQLLFPETGSPLVKLDVKRRGQQVGYLMGAGDEVPEALRQLGYTVTLLKTDDLTADNLRRFDAVVLGIRAYNTLDRLKTLQPNLLQYVEQGGNLIVQYVVNRGTVLPQIGPYPLTLSTDRVTVENAPITFLKPQHPLLNVPNKITAQDFEGWQQEQGLYYPSQWDPKYQTIISSHDPGETAKESAILVADYGKGHYIYTGLSLFRELPAGVPGAYRLLTNMISLGK